jgi:hypothetical protein
MQFSREVEVVRPMDSASLVIPGRVKSELDRRTIPDLLDWDEEAAVHRSAIRGECVDFVGRVQAPHISAPAAAFRITADDDRAVSDDGPFALHANEGRLKIENEVVPLAIKTGLKTLMPSFTAAWTTAASASAPFCPGSMVRTLVRAADGAQPALESPGRL